MPERNFDHLDHLYLRRRGPNPLGSDEGFGHARHLVLRWVLRKGSKEMGEVESRDAFHLIQIELVIGICRIVRPVPESEVRRRQLSLLPGVRERAFRHRA
jgi:hypothetical protein